MGYYTVGRGGIHVGCGFGYASPEHMRSCVPRAKWPEPPERRARVVIDGKVYDADRVPAVVVTDARSLVQGVTFTPDAVICACGFEAKSAFGLRAHQRKHEREA